MCLRPYRNVLAASVFRYHQDTAPLPPIVGEYSVNGDGGVSEPAVISMSILHITGMEVLSPTLNALQLKMIIRP